MSPKFPLLPSLLSVLAFVCPALHADLVLADHDLQMGRVEETTALARSWLAQHPSDPDAHLLLCRAFYAQDMADSAVQECEAAAASVPGSSNVQLWLGRAFGMKASSANPLLAFSLARKVRDAFERSLSLDPANVSAMIDLGELYVAAPPVVGGGSSKARSLATKPQALNQPAGTSQGHRILALLAEKNNNLRIAEAEFRRAAQSNSASAWIAAPWIDLGAFYARHQQPDPVAIAVRNGLNLDKLRGATLVDAASILTAAARDPDLARRVLRQYLASPARSDASPAFKVHLQLGDLLARSADLPSARKEYAAALALAPNFPPARRLALSQQPVSR